MNGDHMNDDDLHRRLEDAFSAPRSPACTTRPPTSTTSSVVVDRRPAGHSSPEASASSPSARSASRCWPVPARRRTPAPTRSHRSIRRRRPRSPSGHRSGRAWDPWVPRTAAKSLTTNRASPSMVRGRRMPPPPRSWLRTPPSCASPTRLPRRASRRRPSRTAAHRQALPRQRRRRSSGRTRLRARAGIDVEGYTVLSGDYPLKVADLFCVSVDELAVANGWSADAREFPFPGAVVRIPDGACPASPPPTSTIPG